LELSTAARFPGRTEETLFGFSVRELSAPDSQARQRAAERLRALGNSAAAPALATALHGETDPPTQVALLRAFSALAKEEGASVVQPLLQSPVADVRIAALKALIEIDPSQTGPHVAAAMSDPDPTVRRRASLLALGLTGDAAMKLGEQALADSDADVRRLGALVLGAGHGEQARTLLLEALRDREQKVRHAAAQSLSRILGQDLSSIVNLEEPQRRREVRRLAQIPARPMQMASNPTALSPAAKALKATVSPVTPSVALSSARSDSVRVGRTAARSATTELVAEAAHASTSAPAVKPTSTAAARTDVRVAAPDTSESLCLSVMTEIRCALRGRSLSELVSVSQSSPEAVEQTCDLLVARGQVVRRGLKYFAA
jgi:HEAT repeat protein